MDRPNILNILTALRVAQLEEKRLVPSTGEVRGYRPPLRRERVVA
jgi:hypothetical protein